MEYTKAINLIESISTEAQASDWLKKSLNDALISKDFLSFARDAKVLSEILDTLVTHSLAPKNVYNAGKYTATNPISKKQKIEG